MNKLDIDEFESLDDKLKRYFYDDEDPDDGLVYSLLYCLLDTLHFCEDLRDEYTDLIQDYDYIVE